MKKFLDISIGEDVMNETTPLVNRRVTHLNRTLTPSEQEKLTPLSPLVEKTVIEGRSQIEGILDGNDKRLIVIAGPCSVDNPNAALKYALQLKKVADDCPNLCVVMRAYFEKPRTTIGWKGFLTDPECLGVCNVNLGRQLTRKLLVKIGEIGLPVATEFLGLNTPQFLDGLISWGALGARTVESQTHRELASGLSVPVGMKNGTNGSIKTAIDAILAASKPHEFVSIEKDGRECVVATSGNEYCHLVLRGGAGVSNHSPAQIAQARAELMNRGLPACIIVDCSHANSGYDHTKQCNVVESVIGQRAHGDSGIVGVMLESYLVEGKQDACSPKPVFGKSVTDTCIGWSETEDLLGRLNDKCSQLI